MALRAVRLYAALLLLSLLLPERSASAQTVRAGPQLAGLSQPFIANEGQTATAVAYYAPTFAGTVFVTRRGELVYGLRGPSSGQPNGRLHFAASAGWTLTERFVRGRGQPVARDRGDTHVSYFVGGDSARWRVDVPTYDEVSLGEVWAGVSVSVRARRGTVEKVFTVQPGASVDRIRVRVAGAQSITVDSKGALVALTGAGPVTFTAPIAHQERDGVRHEVRVAYRQRGREYGFTVGVYDRTVPLVIDPLLQSTYLGGSDLDKATALAIASQTGDVYVAGQTSSTNFPGTAGGPQPAGAGNAEVFVARLSSSLRALVQTTYLGGSDFDHPTALAIAPQSGDVYVAGYTYSKDFPGTAGAAQPASGGGTDAFVARLNSSLTALTRATYLGGSGGNYALALAIAPQSGDVYVAGSTSSTNFPGTAGAAQPAIGGGTDAFVARLTENLAVLARATYLGGGSDDAAHALAINPGTGDVYVAGFTDSGNFPGTTGGAQPWSGGTSDAFVARLPGSLALLTQATYIGGQDSDLANALAIAPTTGDVYVAGQTVSTNFPGTTAGAQPASGGGQDAFVVRLTESLTALSQATYLGGSSFDLASALAIAPDTGDVYVAGQTLSTNFPATTAGVQPANGGGFDGFVARLSRTLTALIQATYLGSSGFEEAQALAIAPTSGDVYVAGSTFPNLDVPESTPDFPGTTGGAQPARGGLYDAFVARLTHGLADVDPSLTAAVSVNQPTFGVGQTLSMSAVVSNSGLPGIADLYLGALLPDGVTIVFWRSGGDLALGNLGDLGSFRPYAAGVSLLAPFSTGMPDFFSYQWTGTEALGSYVFFFFAAKSGALADGVVTDDEILALATTPFSFR